jgi:hypothetical protein
MHIELLSGKLELGDLGTLIAELWFRFQVGELTIYICSDWKDSNPQPPPCQREIGFMITEGNWNSHIFVHTYFLLQKSVYFITNHILPNSAN